MKRQKQSITNLETKHDITYLCYELINTEMTLEQINKSKKLLDKLLKSNRFLEGEEYTFRDKGDYNNFTAAIHTGKIELVQYLIQIGNNPFSSDNPFHHRLTEGSKSIESHMGKLQEKLYAEKLEAEQLKITLAAEKLNAEQLKKELNEKPEDISKREKLNYLQYMLPKKEKKIEQLVDLIAKKENLLTYLQGLMATTKNTAPKSPVSRSTSSKDSTPSPKTSPGSSRRSSPSPKTSPMTSPNKTYRRLDELYDAMEHNKSKSEPSPPGSPARQGIFAHEKERLAQRTNSTASSVSSLTSKVNAKKKINCVAM